MKIYNFYQIRDFVELFSFTFSFIKENVKEIVKFILMYISPFFILLGISVSLLQIESLNIVKVTENFSINDFSITNLSTYYFMFFFISLMSHIFLISSIASYISLYATKGHNNFTTNEVFYNCLIPSLKLAFFSLLLVLSFVLYIAVLVLSASILIIILGILLLIPLSIYLSTSLSMLPMCYVHEHKGFFDGIKQSFTLTHKSWWLTLLIIICAFLITMIINSIIMIPQYISVISLVSQTMFGSKLDSYPYDAIFITTISYFLSSFVAAIPNFLLSIHYFTLALKANNNIPNSSNQNQF